jgi:protein required for attachment to host cells
MHHKLAHGAWVFVGDGQKALFLINEGDEKFPNLRRLAVEEHKAALPVLGAYVRAALTIL